MNIFSLLSHIHKIISSENIGLSPDELLVLYNSKKLTNDGSGTPVDSIGLKCISTLKRVDENTTLEDGYTPVFIEHNKVTRLNDIQVALNSTDEVVYHYKMEWFVDPTEMLTNMGEENKNVKKGKAPIYTIVKGMFDLDIDSAKDDLMDKQPPNDKFIIRMGYIMDKNSNVFNNATILSHPQSTSRKNIKTGSIFTVGYNDTQNDKYTHFAYNFNITENGKYVIDTSGNNIYPLIMRQFAFIEVAVPNKPTVVYLAPFEHYCTAEFTQTNKINNQTIKVTNETVVNEGFDKMFLFVSNNERDYASSSICGKLFKDKQEASWEIPFDCADIKFLCKATDIYTSDKVSALYEECKNGKRIYLKTINDILQSLGLKDTIIDISDLKEYLRKYVDVYIKNQNAKEGIHAVIFNLINNAINIIEKEINFYFEKDDQKIYNSMVYDIICNEMLKLHNGNLEKKEK